MNRFEISEQEVIDHQTGLIWRKAPEPGSFTFHEAQTHAQKTAQQTNLPWRVPTIDELLGLVDHSLSNPATSFPDTPSVVFWSFSPYVGSTNYAWFVNFYYGYVYINVRYSTYAVRLVRGG